MFHNQFSPIFPQLCPVSPNISTLADDNVDPLIDCAHTPQHPPCLLLAHHKGSSSSFFAIQKFAICKHLKKNFNLIHKEILFYEDLELLVV